MKTMKIFESAMCCPTGLCGVAVDPELLRISTVLDTMKKHGSKVDRFNLNSAPMEFVDSKAVSGFLREKGPEGLPVILLDEKIVLTGRYPSNEEFTKWLGLPASLLAISENGEKAQGRKAQEEKAQEEKKQESGGCCCKGGCCYDEII